MYLLAYLSLKDPNSFTGLESFVHARRNERAFDFVPIGQAMVSAPPARGKRAASSGNARS